MCPGKAKARPQASGPVRAKTNSSRGWTRGPAQGVDPGQPLSGAGPPFPLFARLWTRLRLVRLEHRGNHESTSRSQRATSKPVSGKRPELSRSKHHWKVQAFERRAERRTHNHPQAPRKGRGRRLHANRGQAGDPSGRLGEQGGQNNHQSQIFRGCNTPAPTKAWKGPARANLQGTAVFGQSEDFFPGPLIGLF